METQKTPKEIHDSEHDSVKDPQPDCEFCANEVIRGTQRCFGDGSSTTALSRKFNDFD